MFERKEFRKSDNGRTRKGRRQLEWEHAKRKAQERATFEKRENRKRSRRFDDDAERDWRDILMEEGDDRAHDL
jgi:hypothetical protein